MKLLRKIAAPIAALAIGASALATPTAIAGAAEVTPAKIQGDFTAAKITKLDKNRESDRTWVEQTRDNHRVLHFNAYSTSMGRDIPLAVITPNGEFDEARPTIYMLNGAGGAEQNMDWIASSPIVDFYKDKNVNVVIPMEGAFSYYINWHNDSPQAAAPYLNGKQRWEDFLLRELPGGIEPYMKANGKRGIGGYSMSATSALLLAEKAPGFFDVAGSFSGCAETSTFLGYQSAQLTVERAGTSAFEMLGPQNGDHNRANDALVQAHKLRGTSLYISNATGLAGEADMPGTYTAQGYDPLVASVGAAQLQIEGGVIEAATNVCTHNLKAKLDSLDIPATWNLRPVGTHSWNYWIQDLNESWQTFEDALS
ncbi:esterase family protein [Corynebacterium hylobatis]|uniref:Esterase family protein n=1 Tax=Corynebacterium hylobatis TaxID=1859290 RepID=A0A430HZN5_9CORY|nr:alpha/beta hydrolase family protein [Corynebacterium hylobatis]RSZ64387.1 esterase family protein [Corynebacterium hylobatis]